MLCVEMTKYIILINNIAVKNIHVQKDEMQGNVGEKDHGVKRLLLIINFCIMIKIVLLSSSDN